MNTLPFDFDALTRHAEEIRSLTLDLLEWQTRMPDLARAHAVLHQVDRLGARAAHTCRAKGLKVDADEVVAEATGSQELYNLLAGLAELVNPDRAVDTACTRSTRGHGVSRPSRWTRETSRGAANTYDQRYRVVRVGNRWGAVDASTGDALWEHQNGNGAVTRVTYPTVNQARRAVEAHAA